MSNNSSDNIESSTECSVGSGLAMELGQLLLAQGLVLTTAESCTGGLIAGAITDVAGSSAWFEQGLVTYSNEVKQALLGVDETVLIDHGAVSEACVLAMANGALHKSGADIAVAASGIAGPGGATEGKPVGMVWLSWASANGDFADAEVFYFVGNRQQVRQQAVLSALRGTIARIENHGH